MPSLYLILASLDDPQAAWRESMARVAGDPRPVLPGLRDLGWIEGRNIVIERRSAEGRGEQLPGLAADLFRLKVDVIVAAGGPASLNAARAATKTIPIVMIASSSDPVAAGIAQSLARPGSNVTGLASYPEELPGKRLSIL